MCVCVCVCVCVFVCLYVRTHVTAPDHSEAQEPNSDIFSMYSVLLGTTTLCASNSVCHEYCIFPVTYLHWHSHTHSYFTLVSSKPTPCLNACLLRDERTAACHPHVWGTFTRLSGLHLMHGTCRQLIGHDSEASNLPKGVFYTQNWRVELGSFV